MTMNKNVLKKACKRFNDVFGELPAAYGYPAVGMWGGKVLFARSAEDADSYIRAHKILKYTGIIVVPPILILSLYVFIIVGESFKWDIALIALCAICVVSYKLTKCLRKRAHQTIHDLKRMISYNPKDDCFYRV